MSERRKLVTSGTSDTSEGTPLFSHRNGKGSPLTGQSFTNDDKPYKSEASLLLDSDDDEDDDGLSGKRSNYRTMSHASSVAECQPVALTWENLSVFGRRQGSKERVQILRDVTGGVYPGQLVALMGASGAGKTTLLNTLIQRNLKGLEVNGRVCVNGEEIGRGITSLSAYVQQDDLFIGTLTVREHLIFQATLRLPSSMTASAKRRRVDEVIAELGLRKCQHSRIGVAGVQRGISGGETKRLAFASEILTNPSMLFCDEPTTGLDSFMAESVVNVLRRLTHSGKTIVCTIHQPASEIYALFDRVFFLADGRTAFFGGNEAALDFFSSVGYNCPQDFNPADFLIQTLAVLPNEEEECRQRVAAICDQYDRSEYALSVEKMVRETVSGGGSPSSLSASTGDHRGYRSSTLMQFWTLMHRAVLDNWRNPSLARAKIMQKIVMGLFVGLLYLNTPSGQTGIANINGALFYLLSEFTYPALFGIMHFMPADYALVVREHHNGMYSVGTYYVSKALSYVPLFSIDGIILTVISYFMIGLRPTADAFLLAILIGVCIEQAAAACGIMLSSVAPSFPIAISIAGPFLTLLSLTGGLYANVETLPVYISWMQYISWYRYGFEALAANQWHPIENITCTATDLTCLTTGDQVLASYGFDAVYLWRDIALLIASALVFYTIGYIGLAIRIYRSR